MIRDTLDTTSISDGCILKIGGIVKAFKGVTALQRVSFEMQRECIEGLIGPNGAGKTTLLNVISGLLRSDSGQITFDGQDITYLKPEKIALLGMARTFQQVRLFTVNNATVLDNVMLGAHRRIKPGILKSLFLRLKMGKQENTVREAALENLKFVGLEGKENLSPSALSFGNQRMLELARSLMTEPKLLLLDEPASGLNDAEVEKLAEILFFTRAKGITILLVEHNMKLVMNVAEHIVVLDFGVKIAEGDSTRIGTNQEVIKAYLGEDHFKPGT